MKSESFSQRLKKALEFTDTSQAELSRKTGITASSISDWLNGKYEAKQDKIDIIARALGVDHGWLLGYDKDEDGELMPVPPMEYAQIPVFGSVACGEPLEAVNEIIDYTTIPASWLSGGREYLCLTAEGDSMAPLIESGDIAVIRRQPDCENGQICAVFVNGYNATLKKIYKTGDVITLRPLNPAMAPQVYTKNGEEEIHILGVMVELRKQF